jgi:hypothetical protein
MYGAFLSRYESCSVCGAAVERARFTDHVCDAEQLLDVRLFQLRDDIAAFDDQFAAWLDSVRGRFEAWIAERDRLAGEAPS